MATHFTIALTAFDLVALGWCLITAPWRDLAAATRQHGWMGLTVALLLVWTMRAPVGNGMDLHLAGASLAALMFGARLATVALAVVLAVLAFTGHIPLEGLALQGFAFALLPVLLTVAIQRLVQARLPRNVFVYIFATGFAGTLAANVAAAVAFAGMAWLAGASPQAAPAGDYLSYRLLLCWGESILTGMLVAVFVAYRPQWMTTFRDEIYLVRR
jgi:uncharacterized membrane protein